MICSWIRRTFGMGFLAFRPSQAPQPRFVPRCSSVTVWLKPGKGKRLSFDRTMEAFMSNKECVLIEELSWVQIKDLINEGCTTVIVPLGAIEQHGPALPLL